MGVRVRRVVSGAGRGDDAPAASGAGVVTALEHYAAAEEQLECCRIAGRTALGLQPGQERDRAEKRARHHDRLAQLHIGLAMCGVTQ